MTNVLTGRKPVMEALRAGRPLERILILRGTHGSTIDEIRRLAEQRGVTILDSEKQHFREFSPEAMTQGVIAFAPPKKAAELEDILDRHQAERRDRLRPDP